MIQLQREIASHRGRAAALADRAGCAGDARARRRLPRRRSPRPLRASRRWRRRCRRRQRAAPAKPPPPVEPAQTAARRSNAAALRPAGWSDLPGWRADDPAAAWSAFLASCRALAQQDVWRDDLRRRAEHGQPRSRHGAALLRGQPRRPSRSSTPTAPAEGLDHRLLRAAAREAAASRARAIAIPSSACPTICWSSISPRCIRS